MTRAGIEPRSPRPLANTLFIRPMARWMRSYTRNRLLRSVKQLTNNPSQTLLLAIKTFKSNFEQNSFSFANRKRIIIYYETVTGTTTTGQRRPGSNGNEKVTLHSSKLPFQMQLMIIYSPMPKE